MSCILRISGTDFNVDEYLSKTNWEGCDVRVYHKGEQRSPTGRFAPFEDNGFSIRASNAGFEDFEHQQKDVIAFIQTYSNNLGLLKEYNIDRWHCFDFGLGTYPRNQFSRTYILSSQLLQLTGALGLDIWMSNYFTKDDEYIRRRKRKDEKYWPIKK